MRGLLICVKLKKVNEIGGLTKLVLDRSDIKDELEGSFGNYVVEVMLNRAVPFVEDGLKPVQRRILYGEYKMGNLPTKPTVKSARVVGEIMGKYHPHGDCLYKSTLLRLLNGEIITIEEAYKRDVTLDVLGINQKTGEIIPVKAHSFRIGQYANKIYKVKLVNGYEIKATSNHPFRLTNGDWVKAEALKPNMILDYGYVIESTNSSIITCEKAADKQLPIIDSITIEEVENEPMYDFTVDEHENMLICGDEKGELLVCVHNSSIYDALARLSKEWVVREPLVYMHGNNGSIDGDGAAAMRYTECRLSPLAMEMLNGLSKRDTVDWQLTFDDTDHEPVLLPAKFPNILVNGSSGIGVGYATDIPTHNLTEVLEATIKLVENPNASLEEIVAVLPAPDFPTGGIIVGAKTLKDTYALGNGSVKLRGRYHTEVDKSKLLIVFDEIPYGAEKPKMVEKIQSIIENKQLHGLLAVADESGKDGLRFVLTCRKDVDPKVITSYLFKTTDLQKSIKMNMLMIANGKPRQLGVIAILNYFNQFRRSTIIRELNYDLKVDKANLHLYEGFLKMTDHIDEIIQMIKESNSKSESRDKLMTTLEFSELQANKILELQLHRISSADKDEFQAKFDAAEKSIKTLERVLANDKLISKLMIKQYKELITKYGNARKTSIEYEEEEVTIEKLDIISLDEVVVGINADGFIKRSSLRSYQATEMEDNFLALKTDTHKSIIAFTNKGRYYFTPVHKLEDNKWNSQGKHLNTLGVALEDNEVFITISEYNEKLDYLLVKSNGIMKLGEAKDLVVSRVTKMYDCGHVKDEEEVIYAGLIDPKANFGVVTNKKKAMRFSLEDFGETGLKAIGKKAINLGKLSKILSVGIVEEQFPLRAVGQSATFSELLSLL